MKQAMIFAAGLGTRLHAKGNGEGRGAAAHLARNPET